MEALTPKEKKLLLELLSLDMDRIGFNDNEQTVLSEVYRKVKGEKVKEKAKKVNKPVEIKKVKPFKVAITKASGFGGGD